jgi:hypothetical protein
MSSIDTPLVQADVTVTGTGYPHIQLAAPIWPANPVVILR